MKKTILSETFIITDYVSNLLKIDDKEYSSHILKSFKENETLSKNTFHYTSLVKKLNDHHFNNWLFEYLNNHLNTQYDICVSINKSNCLVLQKNKFTFSFHQSDDYKLYDTCDLTFYYVAQIGDKKSNIVIHYNDNNFKDLKYTEVLDNRKIIMFNSNLNHYFTLNENDKDTIIINFELRILKRL
jgi:hypothetical protein